MQKPLLKSSTPVNTSRIRSSPRATRDYIHALHMHLLLLAQLPLLIYTRQRPLIFSCIWCARSLKNCSCWSKGHITPALHVCLISLLAHVILSTKSETAHSANGFTDGQSSDFSNIAINSAIL